MRSVPEIVLAKLARASVRTRSTPSSSVTLTAIEKMVSSAVPRRFHRLRAASPSMVRSAFMPLACWPVDSAPAG